MKLFTDQRDLLQKNYLIIDRCRHLNFVENIAIVNLQHQVLLL